MHLYIHIPFCRRRCAYCDFTTYAGQENRIAAYVEAVAVELAMIGEQEALGQLAASRGLRPSIFFGGGTPSLLAPAQVERLLRAASEIVPREEAEITIEANPGTLMGGGSGAPKDARAYFRALREMGVNRLSLGVQSLHNPTLRLLGRIHTAAEAERCVEQARRAGFDNLNIDMLIGVPTLSPEAAAAHRQSWAATLEALTALGAEHLSLYSLILEAGTLLDEQARRGSFHLPDDDTAAALYETAIEQLAAAGYIHYEISNWARERGGKLLACQHNLAYWRNDDYLGAGAAAHGHIFPQRYANIATIEGYIAAVQAGHRPLAEVVPLAQSDLYAETMFMGLRLNTGVSFAHFRTRCGTAMELVYGKVLAELEEEGLLERTPAAVRFTPRGRLLGNRVFERFVGEA